MLELFGKVLSVRIVTLVDGGEFADHVQVVKETGVKVHFAKP